MKHLSSGILILLLALFAGSILLLLRTKTEVVHLRDDLQVRDKRVEDLQAEIEGVREANTALHVLLTRLRAKPVSFQTPTPPPAEVPQRQDPEEESLALESPDVYEEEEAFQSASIPTGLSPSLPPGTDISQLPTAHPTPSPQLLQMMAQFPEIDQDAVMNQSNTIEEYLKANPHIREEMNKPQGRYGSGIEEVMRQYPDLAEKVRQAEALAEEPQDTP